MLEILTAILLYGLAWHQFSKDRIKTAVLALILAGFLLRIVAASDPFLHEWDERYHALVAKNMMENPFKPMLYKTPLLDYDYKSWSSNHIWLHKQPVPLWLMSLSLKTFGLSAFSLRIPSILCSTLGILLMFFVGKNLFGRSVAFFSSFLFSIHGLIIELGAGRTATDHYDLFFMFFILLAVHFAILFAKSKKTYFNLLCGLSIGLAVLTKWLPALVVLVLWFLLLKGSVFRKFLNKEILLSGVMLLSIVTFVVLPWQIYTHSTFPLEAIWEKKFNFLHITEALDGHAHPFYWHFNAMRISYGELVYIPVLWFGYVCFSKKRNAKYWAILAWVFVPYLFFSLVATKMSAYTLFAAPAIFIVCGLFWRFLRLHKNRFKHMYLVRLFLIGLIALPVRYSLERIKPFAQPTRAYMAEIATLQKIEIEKPLLIFNCQHPIETMFYVDCTAYPNLPTSEALNTFNQKGYEIIIQGK